MKNVKLEKITRMGEHEIHANLVDSKGVALFESHPIANLVEHVLENGLHVENAAEALATYKSLAHKKGK